MFQGTDKKICKVFPISFMLYGTHCSYPSRGWVSLHLKAPFGGFVDEISKKNSAIVGHAFLQVWSILKCYFFLLLFVTSARHPMMQERCLFSLSIEHLFTKYYKQFCFFL